MKDETKEILKYIQKYTDEYETTNLTEIRALQMGYVDTVLLLNYITNLQEENQRLKDIRNQAITYNKVLCKIYDCGIELSNAETNLCILRDEETINLLQGKGDE